MRATTSICHMYMAGSFSFIDIVDKEAPSWLDWKDHKDGYSECELGVKCSRLQD